MDTRNRYVINSHMLVALSNYMAAMDRGEPELAVGHAKQLQSYAYTLLNVARGVAKATPTPTRD